MRIEIGPARLVSEGPGGLGGRASLGGRAGPALAGGYRVRAQTGGLHRLFLIAFCQSSNLNDILATAREQKRSRPPQAIIANSNDRENCEMRYFTIKKYSVPVRDSVGGSSH